MRTVLGLLLATAATHGAPFNPDILGVRLGMPYAEAAARIREQVNPDLIYAITGQEPARGYSRGTLFFSYAGNQRVVLYSSDDGRIIGVDRIVELADEASHRQFRDRIIEKYGTPRKKGGAVMEWWPSRLAPPLACYTQGWQPADATLLAGREPDGRIEPQKENQVIAATTYAANLSFSRGGHGWPAAADLSRCGPMLEVHMDRTISGFGEGLFQFLLYDHGAYLRALKPSTPSAGAVSKAKL